MQFVKDLGTDVLLPAVEEPQRVAQQNGIQQRDVTQKIVLDG